MVAYAKQPAVSQVITHCLDFSSFPTISVFVIFTENNVNVLAAVT